MIGIVEQTGQDQNHGHGGELNDHVQSEHIVQGAQRRQKRARLDAHKVVRHQTHKRGEEEGFQRDADEGREEIDEEVGSDGKDADGQEVEHQVATVLLYLGTERG